MYTNEQARLVVAAKVLAHIVDDKRFVDDDIVSAMLDVIDKIRTKLGGHFIITEMTVKQYDNYMHVHQEMSTLDSMVRQERRDSERKEMIKILLAQYKQTSDKELLDSLNENTE